MAAKKAGAAGKIIGAVVIIGGLYYLYRWFSAPTAARAASLGSGGGSLFGGGTGASGYPSGITAPGLGAYLSGQPTSTNAQNSILAKIAQALQQLSQQKQQAGGGSSGGSAGGSGGGGVASQSLAALRQQMAAIASYSSIANNTPISELGGASLATYNPGSAYLGGVQIPTLPTQNFDVSQLAQPIAAYNPEGLGGGNAIDTTSYDLGTIAPVDYQNFDVSQLGGFSNVANAVASIDTTSYDLGSIAPMDYSAFDVSQLVGGTYV